MQVPHRPNKARLVGANGEAHRGCVRPYDSHLDGAHGIEVLLIHLAPALDLVGIEFIHAMPLLLGQIGLR